MVATYLVERAMTGDDAAFSELVGLSGDRCYAVAYRILRDVERAQDAVQQAFLLAWRDLPRLRDRDRFEVVRRLRQLDALTIDCRAADRFIGERRQRRSPTIAPGSMARVSRSADETM